MAEKKKDPKGNPKEEQYEALRDEGISKDKAGRAASSEDVGGNIGFEDRSREQLLEQAQKIGISGYSDMTRDELIRALIKK